MADEKKRARVLLYGAVQGTGFRPFLFRLAADHGLDGWVANTAFGLILEVEGAAPRLARFLDRMEREKPGPALVTGLELEYLGVAGYSGFEIRPSLEGEKTAFILPDMATCPDCLEEIFTPGNRRYRYPFTNCTYCGPRYTIVESLPYDRPNTTMRGFSLCAACRAEYENPLDRRFHAQPIACPSCGPRLALWDAEGGAVATDEEALQEAVRQLRRGFIVALKGIGGFQLLTDATRPPAVERLRQRKKREEKPFAVLCSWLAQVRQFCRIDVEEERLLVGRAAPILLLSRHPGKAAAGAPAENVAPGNPDLGVMLPYSPLHHLIMAEVGFPLVATSGNLSEEPMCFEEQEALQRLAGIADCFLVHDRPIARPVDDSVARVLHGRPQILRRARGYSPLPIRLQCEAPDLLAVGGHLKNSVALARGRQVFLSQFIGDLETVAADRVFRDTIDTLSRIYGLVPRQVACDAHPDYLSTRYARETGLPVRAVQHHVAHALSCIAEHALEPPALAVVWDGTGYGLDGVIWGGEWFLWEGERVRRLGHFRPFRLPGSAKAVREPFRSAAGLLWEWTSGDVLRLREFFPPDAFRPKEIEILFSMLRQDQNSPWTTSAGRIFDAVSSLLGIRHTNRFEGQAAMELEFLARATPAEDAYPIRWKRENPAQEAAPWIADWEPLLEGLLADLRAGVPAGCLASRFHNSLAACILALQQETGIRQLVLSGGCFQNRLLMERLIAAAPEGVRLYWQQTVPPNDGGIALGQAYAVIHGVTLEK